VISRIFFKKKVLVLEIFMLLKLKIFQKKKEKKPTREF